MWSPALTRTVRIARSGPGCSALGKYSDSSNQIFRKKTSVLKFVDWSRHQPGPIDELKTD